MLSRERPSFALTRRRLAGMLAASAALTTVGATSTAAAPIEPDALLIALADELDSLDARSNALCAAHRDLDYLDTPGIPPIEARRDDVLEALAATPATTMKGFTAKARVLRTKGLRGDMQTHEAIADSLAADILAAATA